MPGGCRRRTGRPPEPALAGSSAGTSGAFLGASRPLQRRRPCLAPFTVTDTTPRVKNLNRAESVRRPQHAVAPRTRAGRDRPPLRPVSEALARSTRAQAAGYAEEQWTATSSPTKSPSESWTPLWPPKLPCCHGSTSGSVITPSTWPRRDPAPIAPPPLSRNTSPRLSGSHGQLRPNGVGVIDTAFELMAPSLPYWSADRADTTADAIGTALGASRLRRTCLAGSSRALTSARAGRKAITRPQSR
jgi:hypothetical protein